MFWQLEKILSSLPISAFSSTVVLDVAKRDPSFCTLGLMGLHYGFHCVCFRKPEKFARSVERSN